MLLKIFLREIAVEKRRIICRISRKEERQKVFFSFNFFLMKYVDNLFGYHIVQSKQ